MPKAGGGLPGPDTLKDLPAAGGKDISFFQDWLDHPDYDNYWRAQALKERYQEVKIPVLQIGGWYDIFTGGTLRNFVAMRERGGSDMAKSHQRAVIGPWIHGASRETHAGDADFGKASMIDLK